MTGSDQDESNLAGMLDVLDLALPPKAERTIKTDFTVKRTRPPKGTKPPKVKGMNPNRPDMPPPTGIFLEAADPKPEYYEEGGLRRVRPYQYAFHSFVKERWENRTVLDVYGEFRDRSQAYYQWAVETGLIMVNNEKTTPETLLRNGDLISNLVHRHEPPVRAGPIRIIYDGRLPGNDGQTLVVEKPGSMPVHSTGRYHFNTLLSILKYDYDLPLVHTSNRLDRLTSGVMVCALTVAKSQELGAWFGGLKGKEEGVQKEYVARCLGKFPEEEVVVDQPLLTIDRQLGVNVVHPQGRESRTIFNRMSYHEASNTSVVHCKPITGRSHQIRVHLQYLGHPIANDPVYQNTAAWGEDGGKGGVFGSDRGGTKEMRKKRREMGEKFMLRSVGVGGPDEEEEEEEIEPEPEADTTLPTASEDPTLPTPTPTPSVTYNKHGDPILSLLTPTQRSLNAQAEADSRTLFDAPLSEKAKQALKELRIVKDADDGWARERDEGALLRGRKSLAKEQGTKVDDEEDLGYCETCFAPEVADPTPDQLYIWLHALRYKTRDWDWSSPLPEWALESWDGSK
ncbi:pseudouridine synthase [Meredithblackwellia eburnea MCA 4105]